MNLSVSEETAELVLDWKSHSVKETVDLLRVESHTGFSTAGRMRSGETQPPSAHMDMFPTLLEFSI